MVVDIQSVNVKFNSRKSYLRNETRAPKWVQFMILIFKLEKLAEMTILVTPKESFLNLSRIAPNKIVPAARTSNSVIYVLVVFMLGL